MAGPNTLNYGDTVSYPTYVWWVPTRIYVKNDDNHYPGKVTVTVQATEASEDVVVNANGTRYIDRSYWGSYVWVQNTGGPTMTVWTK